MAHLGSAKKIERLRTFKDELTWGLNTSECVFISNPDCEESEQQGVVAAEGMWAVLADREHDTIRDKGLVGATLLYQFDAKVDQVETDHA